MPIFCNTKNHKERMIDINKLFKFIRNNWMSLNNHQKKALRNLLHFLELKFENNEKMIKEINMLLKRLKLTQDKPDLYRPHLNDILLTIKQLPLKARIYYYIMLTSGCRINEAINLISNMEKYRKVFHEGFVEIFVEKFGRTKRCFVIFMPRLLFDFVVKHLDKLRPVSRFYLHKQLKRLRNKGMQAINYKYARKWFSSFLVKEGISESIVNFLTGKTARSVLAKNYLNLLELSEEAYSRVVNKLINLLELRDVNEKRIKEITRERVKN